MSCWGELCSLSLARMWRLTLEIFCKQLRPIRLARLARHFDDRPPAPLPLDTVLRHPGPIGRADGRTAGRDDPVRESVRRQLLSGPEDPGARAQVQRVGRVHEPRSGRDGQDEGRRRDPRRGRQRIRRRDQLQDDGEFFLMGSSARPLGVKTRADMQVPILPATSCL